MTPTPSTLLRTSREPHIVTTSHGDDSASRRCQTDRFVDKINLSLCIVEYNDACLFVSQEKAAEQRKKRKYRARQQRAYDRRRKFVRDTEVRRLCGAVYNLYMHVVPVHTAKLNFLLKGALLGQCDSWLYDGGK